MKSLNDIDRTTKEGRLLFAALAKITTESQFGETPEEVLEQLADLADEIDVDSIEQSYTSKEKFTPGPWVAQPMAELDGDNLRVTTDCEWEWEICHLCDGIEENTGETMAANAALIAAAPELYKALSELLEAFRVINDCEVEWTQCENQPEFAIALQALAKARGEVNQPSGANSKK